MVCRQQLAKSFDRCPADLRIRGGCFCGRNGFLGQFRRSAQERPQPHYGFRIYRRMRDGDVGLSQRETRRKLEDDGHLRHRGSRRRGSDEGLVCHVRRCRKQRGHRLLSGILDLTPRCTLLSNMNETLIYTDTRPRARSIGHAFGFEGNLGMPVVISGMLSVFILTMLLNGDNGMPLLAKFLLALLPTALTIAYIMGLRSRRPPRFDLDLLASWVNGRSFQPARIQPRHPFIPNLNHKM
jgi:hypothetical protein